MNKEKTDQEKIRDELLWKVGEYLKSISWNPILAGGIRIQHNSTDLKHNYQLVIEFTGNKPKKESKNKKNEK